MLMDKKFTMASPRDTSKGRGAHLPEYPAKASFINLPGVPRQRMLGKSTLHSNHITRWVQISCKNPMKLNISDVVLDSSGIQ